MITDLGKKLSDLHAKVYSPISNTNERLESHHSMLNNLAKQVNDLAGLVSNQNNRILELSNDLISIKNPAERSRTCTPPQRIEVYNSLLLF